MNDKVLQCGRPKITLESETIIKFGGNNIENSPSKRHRQVTYKRRITILDIKWKFKTFN